MENQESSSSNKNDSGLRLQIADLKEAETPEESQEPKRKKAPGGKVRCTHCGRPVLPSGIKFHESNCAKRKLPEQHAPEIKIIITPALVGMAWAGCFDIVAIVGGEHWHLSELEAQALGSSWKEVLSAYFPDLMNSKAGILVLALIQTSGVIAPRLREQLKSRQKKRAAYPGGAGGKREDHATEDSALAIA